MRATMLMWLVAGLALVLALAAGTWADCQASGVTGAAGSYSLTCDGPCDPGQTGCASYSGADTVGSYTYCGCFQGDEPLFSECCTVVIRQGVPKKKGICTTCPASGSCKLVNNPEGSNFEPTCTSLP